MQRPTCPTTQQVSGFPSSARSVARAIGSEGVSLLENAGHLGLPIPAKLKDVLEQLHDRAEKEEDKNE